LEGNTLPNIKAKKKHVILSEQNRIKNKEYRSEIKTLTKKFVSFIDNSDIPAADALLKQIIALLDRSVAKNIYKKNTVARKKSALTIMLNVAKAA
jgi:small subunit ribosomal protein S20